MDLQFQNAMQLYSTVALNYGRDLACLVSHLKDDEYDGFRWWYYHEIWSFGSLICLSRVYIWDREGA